MKNLIDQTVQFLKDVRTFVYGDKSVSPSETKW
ncbi:hypothetical protein AP058_01893 [Flavobacterium sp. TAB 87]|nr:hypothetical protein AP058_01893 [Flavobacterium sp. TAB 87]